MLVRHMESKDVDQVAGLCSQFGYPASNQEIEERFQHVQRTVHHQIFVAEDNVIISGWIHLHGIHSLSSPPYVEIRGIVVDTEYRGQGVGRLLMTQAEQWALENGFPTIRLRSSVDRPEAHRFYPKLGYERTKTQHHYQKILTNS